MSKHDAALQKSASEVYKYKKQVETAQKQLNGLTQNARGAAGSMSGFFKSLSSGSASGMAKGLEGMAGSISSMIPQVSNLSSGITAGMAAAGVAGVAFTGLAAAIGSNISIAAQFEKSMSKVQALTGMAGEALNDLKKRAIELGGSCTYTSSQVVDAFGLIGSKKPDLLKSGEALAETTKYAIMLAEAAGMQLEPAADALTGVMNQFGLKSDKAKEIVNLLAAASQNGAGDIQYLNSAIVNCGSVAGTLGIKVNQVVAQLEMLAQSGVEASSAGNQLKNIMLTLEASTDQNLKPSIVGLNGALENLAQQHLNTTEMTKLFGKENVAAALTLTNMAQEAQKLTNTITGTNTAEEQQEIMNNNLQGSLKNLSSKWEELNLTINSSTGIFKDFVDGCSDALSAITDLIKAIDEGTSKSNEFIKSFKQSGKIPIQEMRLMVGDRVDKKGDAGAQVLKESKSYEEAIKRYNKLKAGLDALKKETNERIKNNNGRENVDQLKQTLKEIDKADKEYQGIVESIKNKEYSIHTQDKKTPKVEPKKEPAATTGGTTKTTGTKKETPITSQDIAKFDKREGLAFPTEPVGPQQGSIAYAKDRIKDIQQKIDLSVKGSDEYNQLKEQLEYWQAQTVDIPIKLDVQQGEKLEEVPKKAADGYETLSKKIGKFGDAFSSIGQDLDIPELDVAGTIASGIAQLVMGYGQASVKASGSGPFGWIAFVLTGLATLATVIAQIHSLSGHANGGIIKGKTTIGDYNLAKVNAGEMILNGSQQKRLFDIANAGLSTTSENTDNVSFRITGSNLVGVMSNYEQRRRRVL